VKINRQQWLKQLEAVEPGLASREIIEQSSCFVFNDGKVQTFNDEVAVTADCPVEITGAVPADPLLKLLRKLKEEELEVEVTDGELQVKGKGRRAGIRMEEKVVLPVEVVEDVGKWKKLPDGFLDALKVVIQVVGRDESMFACTCVHIHPEWLEGSDNYQVLRYPLETGVGGSTLVRRDALRHVIGLGVTKFSETDSWVHFKNKQGVVISCRRYAEGYPDIGSVLDVSGESVTLPKGIEGIVDKAQVFSSESKIESDSLTVRLRKGKIEIEGRGPDGWYAERGEVEYDGRSMQFTIAPKLLLEVVKRGCKCEVTSGRLKIDGGKWSYVTCLGVVAEERV